MFGGYFGTLYFGDYFGGGADAEILQPVKPSPVDGGFRRVSRAVIPSRRGARHPG